ncbi:MAG: SEC-C motif protein [Chloroflexi bacterium ADurb.Bin360]|nr:MAG: SEC-C motif protein [Chloroflexi bacterium ADurb.Bin360]
MKKSPVIGVGIVLLLVGSVIIAIIGGLLVLLAYGVGLLVNLVMNFEPFHATLLSLVGMIAAGVLVVRVVSALIPGPFSDLESEDNLDDDEDDDDDGDDDKGDVHLCQPGAHPETLRLRPPFKPANFAGVRPDDRCPCGSGRKYKNCHGAKPGKV